MLTSVPGWAWAFVVLILGGFCSVGWWAIKRWIERVDSKLERMGDNFNRLPCVAESNKIRPPGGNSMPAKLTCLTDLPAHDKV